MRDARSMLSAVSSDEPDRSDIVVLAVQAQDLDPVAKDLRRLADCGREVHIATWNGPVNGTLAEHTQCHQVERPAVTALTRLARGVARLTRRNTPVDEVSELLPDDPWLEAALALAAEVFVLGPDPLAETVHRSTGRPVHTGEAARDELANRCAGAEAETLDRIDALVRTRKHTKARRLAERYRTSGQTGAATVAAWDAAMHLTDSGTATSDVTAVAGAACAAADREWSRGRVVPATYALSAALRLLFHPDLHADVEHPPLARDPRTFLAPLYSSTMFQDLIRPNSEAVTAPAGSGATLPMSTGPGDRDRITKVLVLTGTYPRFSPPLVLALGQHPGTEIATLALSETDRRFKWLGANTDALGWRVAAHPHGRGARAIGGDPSQHAHLLAGADVVVAEWGDRGAMWASTAVPDGVRLVIRLHGMDLFSPWVHLIDWTRVDDLVLVSAPLRDLAVRLLAGRLDGVRIHVVEHAVNSGRFSGESAAGAERTVGMIGWGKIVKDPAWALAVLERLLEYDPSWRLLLVGHPLEASTDGRLADYAEAFWNRADGHLSDRIEYVAQTDDVPAHAARMGFILSASRRESFHLGLLEGALAGAVPVVRDWPVYAQGEGPRGIFPPAWVVPDPGEAAERIISLSDPQDRERAAGQARAEALQRFDPERFASHIREVILRD